MSMCILKIALESSCVGDFSADPENFVVRVSEDNRSDVLITFSFKGDTKFSADYDATDIKLPGFSDFHVLGVVMQAIWNAYCVQECEFMTDIFDDNKVLEVDYTSYIALS